jgi:serine phosphatase RsbU (regulator of sigma subunit)
VKTAEGFEIEDLHSSNGTFVNGKRLEPQKRIAVTERDSIAIGPYTLGLRALPTPAATEAHLVIREQVHATSLRDSGYGQDPAQKLKTVLEISQQLARTLDLDALIDKLLEQLMRLFPQADRGMVLLGEPEHMVVRGQRSRHQEDASTHPYSRTIVKKALDEGIGILSDDIHADARFQGSGTITSLQIRSLLCVPLISADQKRLGVIQLDRTRPPSSTSPATGKGGFKMDDLELLTTIGLQVAVVLDNAALHQEVLREQRLHQELALARDIQLGYLPTDFGDFAKDRFEVFACVHPARQVSGDLYDFMELPDGRLGFFLGDVSGKGMPAALYMVAVHTLGRHLAASSNPPSKALMCLNDALVKENHNGMFVTLAHGQCNRATGEVIYASAGHPLPLLRHADGKVESLDHKTGRLLGYETGNLHLADIRLTLKAGEMLVFYTDGVTEARDPAKRQMFGLGRLCDVVSGFVAAFPLSVCAERIKGAVDRFTASAELQDDLTMLFLRRLP